MSESSPVDSLYIGLMSGTSMDGIDAAAVRFGNGNCELIATRATPYPDELAKLLRSIRYAPNELTVDAIGALDTEVGECFSNAAIEASTPLNVSRLFNNLISL